MRQTHLFWGAVVLFWLALLSIVAIAVVWLWHLLGPSNKHWLSAEEQNGLQAILISALGSSLVTQVARGWITPSSNGSNGDHPPS